MRDRLKIAGAAALVFSIVVEGVLLWIMGASVENALKAGIFAGFELVVAFVLTLGLLMLAYPRP